MIKVLMFNKLYHAYLGGVERVVYDICQEIKGKVQLTVLAANTGWKTEIEYKEDHKIIRAGSLGRMLSSVHLAIGVPFWWCRIKSDIIHFNFPSPVAELYCLIACPKKKPLVVSYHADIVGHDKALAFYKPILTGFLKRADRIIVSSPNLIEHSPFLARFKHKCTVIPFGIDTERFQLTKKVREKSEEIRKRFKGPIVLFIGRLVKYKGVEYLVRAMKEVDATLLIAGKGDQGWVLRELADNLGLNNRKIFFLNTLEDDKLAYYYHASDVFVLPSITAQEAFGVVQLEAQACAKPVVSTALPTGVPFVNLDGITGIIVPPKSSEKLAEAINKLLKDDGLRERLGTQAKKRVESEFTREIMGQKILDLYNELTAE